jgi:hypothetical protein
LSDPFGFDKVNQFNHLALQLYQLSACLPKASVGIGPLLEAFKLCGLRCDVPRPGAAAVGEHFGLMQMPLGAAAVWLSATAFEHVYRTGQERFSFEEDLLQLLDVLGELKQLNAEGAEGLGHVCSSWCERCVSVPCYIYPPTDFKSNEKEIVSEAKRRREPVDGNRVARIRVAGPSGPQERAKQLFEE